MISQQQLGNPQQPVHEAYPLWPGSGNAGLLGNERQAPSLQTVTEALINSYFLLRITSHPGLKLAILKEQKFKAEGREQRVAMSLAALNATQPTQLSPAEWKEIVEEIDDFED